MKRLSQREKNAINEHLDRPSTPKETTPLGEINAPGYDPAEPTHGDASSEEVIMDEKEIMDSASADETPEANPFDPSKLRLSQNFAASAGVKKLVTTILVRKPSKQDFIRVHPDPAYRLDTAVLELKEDRETYLVAPELWPELPGELIPKVLFTAINRQGVLFVWPVRLPGEDGRHDHWNASALEAAVMAQKDWLRVSPNMSLGAYEVYQSTGALPDPEWPELEFAKILEIAFKGHYITSLDHPALRRLRGEL